MTRRPLYASFGLLLLFGCSKGGPSPVIADDPIRDVDLDRYDPHFQVDWPDKPKEVCQKESLGRHTVIWHRSSVMERTPEGTLLYAVWVFEYPPDYVGLADPRGLMRSHIEQPETARIDDVLHGPQRYLALSVTNEIQGMHERELLVSAGPRTYSVKVTARRQNALRGDKADAFFRSFRITD